MYTVVAPPYYEHVVTCAAGCAEIQNCNMDPGLPRRYLPRGTTSRAKPGHVQLMVVLANPRTPQEVEDRHYSMSPERVAGAAWAFTEAVLERQVRQRLAARRSATHDVLMRHLAADVFGCPVGEVLDRVVVTNAVRCSTPRKFGDYPPDVRLAVAEVCVTRHLLGEIADWQPKLIVACGKPAREVLEEFRRRGFIGIPLVETRHPSALGSFIAERKEQFRAIRDVLRRGGLDAETARDSRRPAG